VRPHPPLAPVLDTKEAWAEYVDSQPVPPPDLPGPEVRRSMTPSARASLDDARLRYHSAFVTVLTPAMDRIHRAARRTVLANLNAPPGARRGLVIDGDAYTGKTTVATSFARSHELAVRARYPGGTSATGDQLIPVIYITVPPAATPKMLSRAMAEFLALPMGARATATEITDAVCKVSTRCATSLVVVDDVHYLDLSQKEGRLANDHLKYLGNKVPATFLYAGIGCEENALFSEGRQNAGRFSQTASRFVPYRMGPFGWGTRTEKEDWVRVVKAMDDALRLFEHQPGSLWRKASMAEYLHRRTRGKVGTLSGLIREGAIEAILSGAEALNEGLLDSIAVDQAAETAYRGEVAKAEGRKRGAGSGPAKLAV